MLERLQPIGFWSYARQDDVASRGRLSALRTLLGEELQQLYGRQDVKIFQDVAAIPPGAEWESAIDEALQRATFLIPIITPAFIESEWCCKEFAKFLKREKLINDTYPQLKGRRRIFPIRYIDVKGVDPLDPAVVAEIARLQSIDFRRLRLVDDKRDDVRQELSRLAEEIKQLLLIKVEAPPSSDELAARNAEREPARAQDQRPGDRAMEAPARATETQHGDPAPPSGASAPPPPRRWRAPKWAPAGLAAAMGGVVAVIVAIGLLTHRFVPPAVEPDLPPAPEAPPALPDARSLASSTSAPELPVGVQPTAFQAFRDCADCLDMVAMPGGKFTMGSPKSEPGRDTDEGQVSVTVPHFAVSRFPVTKGEYAAFVQATGQPTEGGCDTDRAEPGTWAPDPLGTWRDPGFVQTDREPVVCVNAAEAEAFAAWMTKRTHQAYRLVTESEYEYANRAGTTTPYFWGTDAEAACAYANVADLAAKRVYSGWTIADCDDSYVHTSPVGARKPNPWGLFDITGDVFSWTADCYAASNESNPRNGQANRGGDCSRRVLRGGSWGSFPRNCRSAYRDWDLATYRNGDIGFRLARTLSLPAS